ncbi:hypothetical protein NH26_11590 [Flammeovirga pacifica]|uniref:Secretion system C-terminal sorting domain-containing protein n=2 Tax=Flammeovirga pacifica TaxID=915059 RepID=A0A1S1Z118_FLAPC|nr:hypothetical protein NH26_11590 [Flammeovirga pacifica]
MFLILTIGNSCFGQSNVQIIQPDSIVNFHGETQIHIQQGFYKFIRVKSNTRLIIDGELFLSDRLPDSKLPLSYGTPVISDTTTITGYHHIGMGCVIILEPHSHLEVNGRLHDLATQLSIILKDHSQIIVEDLFTFKLAAENPNHIISFGSGSQIIVQGRTNIRLNPSEYTDLVNNLHRSDLDFLITIGKFLLIDPRVDISDRQSINEGIDRFITNNRNPIVQRNFIIDVDSLNHPNAMSLDQVKEFYGYLLHTFDNQVRFLGMGPLTNMSRLYFDLEHKYAELQLPIELSSFNVTVQPNDTFSVNWTTQTEINADHFTLEYSPNTIDFEMLDDNIPAYGNSNVERKYEVNNLFHNTPTGYVRLTEYDFDGANQSWIEEIRSTSLKDLFSYQHIYPNPVANQLHVDFNNNDDNDIYLSLIDIETGRVVYEKTLHHQTSLDLNTSSFSNGIYLMNAKSGINREYKEVVIMH